MSDDLEHSSATGVGDASSSDAAAQQTAQQIELLTRSVGMLAEGLQKMEGNQGNIVAALAKITDMSKSEVRAQVAEDFGDDVDLEQLDRKSFAKFLMDNISKSFKSELESSMKSIDARVTNLATSFESKNATEQIAKTAEHNADFWEWSAEIKQILSENPSLTVNRAYNLVKAENPDKVQTLQKKYTKEPAKKEPSFLGLTPTSSVSTRGSATGKQNARAAAESAFDKIMGDLGDVIQNGDIKLV